MGRWTLGMLAGSLVVAAAATEVEVRAQDAQQQPPVAQDQPPIAGGNGQIITTGNGQQPTIIVLQGGVAPAPPHKRRTIPAEEGQPPPAGYHVESHMMKGLAIAGWSVFGAGYLLTVISGGVVGLVDTVSDGGVGSSGWVGFIPVAGPWIYVSNSNIGDARIWFGFLGVMQAGGLAMGIAGLAAHTDVWVSDEAKQRGYGPRFGVGAGNLSFTTNF